jgi:ATP-dependent Lhr-like helicase
VAEWFGSRFPGPTPAQSAGWSGIAAGHNTLIAAPTGSGKTLAAFLWALNELVRRGLEGRLEDRVDVVYVSPLKALGNDVERNLREPLSGIALEAARRGTPLPEIRVAVRSGDTSPRERHLQVRRPPHVWITTPESLFLLLTAERGRAALREARTVIVDEIHAVAGDKRGAHLALSLERLDRLCGRRLQRIGLSATQRPIEEIARLLAGGSSPCAVVDVGHCRDLDLRVAVPERELGPIPSQEVRAEVYDRIAEAIRAHRSTIVFVNTRRLVERVAHALSERLGDGRVAAHHGSLSRELRLRAEQGLKHGEIRVVVATASLELGIDVGHVDLVCHLGAPRALATLLQRVGRSGHSLETIPKGILFPLTRDELLQCAAAVRAVRSGQLDSTNLPRHPLDILAQQIVAITACEEIGVEELWALVRGAYPYQALPRRDFDAVVDMLSEGIATRRGRRGAYLHYDRVHRRLRPRRGARQAALTSGGAIPDTADYEVVLDPDGTVIGKVNEDFAVESLAGDIFLLGNRSWRIRRVEANRVRVEDAQGQPPTIPFWLGEAPARTRELSAAVSDLRREIAERRHDPLAAKTWLTAEAAVDPWGAEQLVRYIDQTVSVLGGVPTGDTLVAERFFDEAGGMQLVLHAPFGGRINRALGLALRKRFCVTFDFELQAAATDDGVVISLGQAHSFPLETVFSMVRSGTFEQDLIQAALRSPMFVHRWRWNSTRALALLRHQGGRRVPMPIQRMRAEDLLAAVFPAQLACPDNGGGPLVAPDHPLVRETLENCLHEAMDADGLREVLERIERGEIRTLAVETPVPSPMSHEILNANPYAFLDDAPLEERRARAVQLRRVDPDLARGVGALDPEAIAEVRRQAWPAAVEAEDVHDALLTLGFLPEAEAGSWRPWLEDLLAAGRATRAILVPSGPEVFVAAERIAWVRAAFPGCRFAPEIEPPRETTRGVPQDPDAALAILLGGWMDSLGPVTLEGLTARLGVAQERLAAALARLEAEGRILQGSFTPGAGTEWCERGLLARIHRLTLARLRQEIEPVAPADLMRFLLRWQHATPGTRLHGREGLLAIVRQLQGLELPAVAWERDVFPARIARYDPADLENLCWAGEIGWGRLSLAPLREDTERSPVGSARPIRPSRSAPVSFFLRADLETLLEPARPENPLESLSPCAREVHGYLEGHGASFLQDIARAIRRLPAEVEEALWELVACGLVTGDGVAGLRGLLEPGQKRRDRSRDLQRAGSSRRAFTGGRRSVPAGRWSLLRGAARTAEPHERTEASTRCLLLRWGVVCRELLARERCMPPWHRILAELRRMEARGEVRGGRFVEGLVGEQFALPEAVELLRALRRERPAGEVVIVAAADPLNLVGIVVPGSRVSPFSNQAIAYRDGTPVEIGELGRLRSRLQRRGTPGAGAMSRVGILEIPADCR